MKYLTGGNKLLAKLTMKLRPTKKLSYNMSSLFQGAIMEMLPRDYGDFLHLSQHKPYTIYLTKENDVWFLVVTAMNEDTYKIVIEKTLSNLKELYIRHNDNLIYIDESIIYKKTKRMVTEAFYNKQTSRIIDVQFITPTAFKSQGEYVFSRI